MMSEMINVFWFRRDLRLEDNHALFRACSEPLPVLAIFIFDTEILKEFDNPLDKRITFIYNTLHKVNTCLKKHGSALMLKHGKPVEVFSQLLSDYPIQDVFCNHDYEPYSEKRDQEVRTLLHEHGANLKTFKDHVIFEKDEILTTEQNPYTVFTPYMKKWKNQYSLRSHEIYPSEKLLHKTIDAGHFIPELESLGYKLVKFSFPSSEIPEEIVKNYHQTRNFPAIEGTSKLGLHLRFGTISIRKTVARAFHLNEVWLNELIWREFFMQLLWHFPHVENESFRKRYQFIEWRNNEEDFLLWCRGETGFSIVDAGMKELLETGHMHNRVRMIVANFLTKLLLIDWRWGERFFADHLLDYELSSNNGNWQWSAGTGADAAPYFRIFNPAEQIRKFDPHMKYVRKWINPDGETYPKPMVDYTFARKRCLELYKQY